MTAGSALKIIFAGSGEFGLPTLRALQSQVVQVISQPDRPAGRGRTLTPTPVAKFAIDNNLPLVRTENINAEKLARADVMVVIAFGQKISQAQANLPRLGSVNLHASLLPKFRGAAPIAGAILAGDRATGNSIIRLAERMDAGDILGQSHLEIGEIETAGELHDRLAIDGPGLMRSVLADLAAARILPLEQDHNLATTSPKWTRQDAAIVWSAPAAAIARRIRALWPWPGCRVKLLDGAGTEIGRLSLARARPAASEGSRWSDGEIETTGCICAAGATGAVEILEVQPEGRRVMPLADFRRGHPWMPGMKIQSIV
jgi:methionyl-tRNA formyltransferase